MQKNSENEVSRQSDQRAHSYQEPPFPGLPQIKKDAYQEERCHHESEKTQNKAVSKEGSQRQSDTTGKGLIRLANFPSPADEYDGKRTEGQPGAKGEKPRAGLHECPELDMEGFPQYQQRKCEEEEAALKFSTHRYRKSI